MEVAFFVNFSLCFFFSAHENNLSTHWRLGEKQKLLVCSCGWVMQSNSMANNNLSSKNTPKKTGGLRAENDFPSKHEKFALQIAPLIATKMLEPTLILIEYRNKNSEKAAYFLFSLSTSKREKSKCKKYLFSPFPTSCWTILQEIVHSYVVEFRNVLRLILEFQNVFCPARSRGWRPHLTKHFRDPKSVNQRISSTSETLSGEFWGFKIVKSLVGCRHFWGSCF